MDFTIFIASLVALLTINVTPARCQGPVYVDPSSGIIVEGPKDGPQLDLTTQTVYGFLDFTTTIGNTVMVFSPQSAPDPNQPKPEEKPVIETQPSTEAAKIESESQDIKPSKPISEPSSEKKDSKPSQEAKVSKNSLKVATNKEPQSIVNVVQGPASVVKEAPKILSSKVEVIAASSVDQPKPILSKVDVVVGPSKVIESPPKKAIYSKVEVKEGPKSEEILSEVEVRSDLSSVVTSPKILSSHVEVLEASSLNSHPTTSILSSVIEVHSSSESAADEDDDEEPILIPNNNIGEPEYDFLSRQPSEIVEETYKVINLRPSKSHKPKHKPRANNPPPPKEMDDNEHPLGLVTTLGGTVVKDGVTTVHETSVIGTVISGKYAQVLQSTSHVYQGSGHKPKINASPTLRILKTAAPNQGKNQRFTLEPTPASFLSDETSLPLENLFGSSPNLIRPSRRPAISGGNFKNRYRQLDTSAPEEEEEPQYKPPPSRNHSNKKNKQHSNAQPRTFSNRFGKSSSQTPQLATVSVFSEPASTSNRRFKSSRSFKSTATTTPSDSYTRRGFKPKVQPSAVDSVTGAATTSLYKFKLNRTPGRWQYKTTPKPRVTIKKIIGFDEPTTPLTSTSLDDAHGNEINPQSRSDNLDLELSGSHNGPGSLLDDEPNDNSIEKPPPVETIKVEISTPADFKDIYYEIATIKSPYTFQVGTVKNTRYITVTSTFEKSFETETPAVRSTEPLTENILATASHFDKENNLLDTSIATLPPIILNGDAETPPLETLTETFSTTQTMLKTHILPVVYNGGNTSSYTLIQTYHVTRLVTATKTLPPMEIYQFVPSKTLNEFNSRLDEAGSELHLELEFGDENENDEEGTLRRSFPADLNLANIGSDFDLSDVDKSRFPDHLRLKKAHSSNPKVQQVTEAPTPSTPALTPEQAQQLALLRLLNPAAAAQIPSVITTSKPVIKVETIYESHVIPFFNGQSTVHSTISRPVATVTKTEYEIGTSSLPPIPQLNPLNPFQQQNPFQITSTPIVTQTEVTATESKVLKLTFGAKTAYTTLYSTRVVPTVLTTYLTASVPVQPSAAYPGYFPAPYAPFPFVG